MIDQEKLVPETQVSGTTLFENLPKFIRPAVAAAVLGVSINTIYDWKYRHKERKIPADLFLKISRLLFIRTEVLEQWIVSQNPSLVGR